MRARTPNPEKVFLDKPDIEPLFASVDYSTDVCALAVKSVVGAIGPEGAAARIKRLIPVIPGVVAGEPSIHPPADKSPSAYWAYLALRRKDGGATVYNSAWYDEDWHLTDEQRRAKGKERKIANLLDFMSGRLDLSVQVVEDLEPTDVFARYDMAVREERRTPELVHANYPDPNIYTSEGINEVVRILTETKT